MDFMGIQNGASSKHECAKADRSSPLILTTPVRKNGFVLCGQIPEYLGRQLVVIDFDGKINWEHDQIKGLCESTYCVRSGSGGLHVYFFVTDGESIPNASKKKEQLSTDAMKLGELKGIDIRGHNGIIFAEGCKFEEHPSNYQSCGQNQLKSMSYQNWMELNTWLFNKPKSKKKIEEMMPTVTSKEEIHDVAGIIIKSNEKHKGCHEFWLKYALYCKYLGITEEVSEEIFDLVEAQFADFISEDIDSDRRRAIQDAFLYEKGVGFGLEEFFSKSDWSKLKKMMAKLGSKFAEAMKLMDSEFVYLKWIAFFQSDILPNRPIIYLKEIDQWAEYNSQRGRYEDRFPEMIEKMITDWCDANKINTKTHLAHLFKRTVILCTKSERETQHFPLICLKNCLYDLKTKEMQLHDPNIIFYKSDISNREYIPHTRAPPMEWTSMLMRIPDEEQRRNCLQFIINAVQRDLSDESFMIIFGKKRGGKGTMLNAVAKLFDGATGTVPFSKIGQSFSLWGLYNQSINIDYDMSGKKWEEDAITNIKILTGRDCEMEINGKQIKQFKWPVRCALLGAANHLPRIHVNDDSFQAVMARLILIEIPTTVSIIDPEFKTKASSDEVADIMFSYCLDSPTGYIIPKSAVELDDYTSRMWLIWQRNADIIFKCVSEVYEFNGEGGDKNPAWRASCEEVRSKITELLENVYDVATPEASLMALRKQEIGEALRHMGITRHGSDYWYIKERGVSSPPVEVVTPPSSSPPDTDDEAYTEIDQFVEEFK